MQNILTTLEQLRHARLTHLGRAADLQHFTFAAIGGHELALHILCPWRLLDSTGILTGHGDYWREASADLDPDACERGAVGMRLRDARNSAVRALLGLDGRRVHEIVVDTVGGFTLHLDGDMRLDVFPDSSMATHDEVEFWRLFERDDEHFVVSSNGTDRVGEG